MSTRRFDGIKYEGFDRLGEAECRSIFDHLAARVDAAVAERDEMGAHMAIQGWVQAEEVFGDMDLPVVELAPGEIGAVAINLARLGNPEE